MNELKNHISGYIWHKSFTHTVKCSFFNQIIVYQSFYDAPLTFNYVLLQGKVLCFARVGKSLVRCLLSEAADQTLWKKLYLWSYLTQIVHSNGKKLFLQTNIIVNQSFYGVPPHLVFFYFKEKFCVLAHVGKSLARYLSSSVYTAFQPCRKKYISRYI